MDFAELDATVQTLTRDRDRLREDLDRLRREFDHLDGKLRYPGTKFLVDLEYRLVYEDTLTTASTVFITPTFETLPGPLHAVYVLSAYPTTTTGVVMADGVLSVVPASTVGVAVLRQYLTSPSRIAASVIVSNNSGGSVTVAVRVWRRLGMGSST